MSFLSTMFGTTPGVFLGLTLVFMGGCAFMAGQALASTWRSAWQALPYGLLLGSVDRFLVYGLFGGKLLSLPGYLLDTGLLVGIALLAYRFTRTGQMVNQYPWLYRRTGLLNWAKRNGHGA